MNYFEIFMYCLIGFVCGMLWRMGGAKGFDKLWRRIGCAVLMFCCILINSNMMWKEMLIAYALITWGCCSYFGWINYIVRLWGKEIEMEREYWWNFLAEGIVIQSAAMVGSISIENALTGILCALVASFGKVWIDKDKDGQILFWKKDVFSEWYYAAVMIAGLIINVKVCLF